MANRATEDDKKCFPGRRAKLPIVEKVDNLERQVFGLLEGLYIYNEGIGEEIIELLGKHGYVDKQEADAQEEMIVAALKRKLPKCPLIDVTVTLPIIGSVTANNVLNKARRSIKGDAEVIKLLCSVLSGDNLHAKLARRRVGSKIELPQELVDAAEQIDHDEMDNSNVLGFLQDFFERPWVTGEYLRDFGELICDATEREKADAVITFIEDGVNMLRKGPPKKYAGYRAGLVELLALLGATDIEKTLNMGEATAILSEAFGIGVSVLLPEDFEVDLDILQDAVDDIGESLKPVFENLVWNERADRPKYKIEVGPCSCLAEALSFVEDWDPLWGYMETDALSADLPKLAGLTGMV